MPADLIQILNPGWPYRWDGRTWRMSAIGPGTRARLSQLLRSRRLIEAPAGAETAAAAAIAAGEAEPDSDWGRAQLAGDDGHVLIAAALLNTRHPDVTTDQVRTMFAAADADQEISAAMTLALLDTGDEPDDPAGEAPDWAEIFAGIWAAHPSWTPAEVAAMSDRALLTAARAAERAAIGDAEVIQGGFTADEVLGPPRESANG